MRDLECEKYLGAIFSLPFIQEAPYFTLQLTLNRL